MKLAEALVWRADRRARLAQRTWSPDDARDQEGDHLAGEVQLLLDEAERLAGEIEYLARRVN